MPIVDVRSEKMSGDRRPDWSKLTAAGIFRVPREGGRFDRHYHDCDEYWLIYCGRARVLTEGIEYEVGPGDIVCTETGQEHDVLVVYEDLEAFFLEDAVPAGGRTGHLHRTPEARAGHPVATGDPAR
jgi:mannose-6-phosphate isomerase-like protein (cupin superfamily)